MKESASGRFILSILHIALLLIIFVLAEPGPASAQDLDNVTITGQVVDQNGAIIPGAAVEVVLAKTLAVRGIQTDSEGRYRFIQLEPGVYNLRVSFAGFAPLEKKDLTLVAGENLQLDLTLMQQGVMV